MSDPPDFANYPRQRLRVRWMRRDLLTSLVTERRLRSNDDSGAVKLGDLGLYPDTLIELLTPIVHPEFKAAGDPQFVAAVALMDGNRTVKEVAAQLGRITAWDEHRAFQYTRGVFLHLVARRWCVPSH